MKSFIIVTDNSEKYIKEVLYSLLPLQENEEIIIFDNHSTDNTVPNIIAAMGILWADKKSRYRFYINKKKENYEIVKNKALSIAKGMPFIIEQKERFDISEVLKDVKNK